MLKHNVETIYDGDMIVPSYDASNLICKNETKKVNNVVIGGNERYIGNDNVAVMVCVDKYKIFDIMIQIEFDFFITYQGASPKPRSSKLGWCLYSPLLFGWNTIVESCQNASLNL